MKNIFATAIVAIAMLMASCGSAKQAVSATTVSATTTTTTTTQAATQKPAVNAPLHAISNSFGAWRTLKASGSVSLGGSINLSSSMQLRMQRGKSVMVSVRPMGMVEVARLVITGDTLLVIDKLHKRYILENVSLITGGVPVDVNTLQDLLLGRAFVLGKGTLTPSMAGDVTLSQEADNYLLKPNKQYRGFDYGFTFNDKHQITATKVAPAKPMQGAADYSVNYAKVKKTVAGNVAGSIAIATQVAKRQFNFSLDYGSFTWNEAVSIDSSIPKNYKRVSGDNLTSLFAQ